jgi:hypothetical protein
MINNCVRYIFNLRKYDHISASYDKLGWLRISERRDFQTLCAVYKMLHEPQPPYLSDLFILMNKFMSVKQDHIDTICKFPMQGLIIHLL